MKNLLSILIVPVLILLTSNIEAQTRDQNVPIVMKVSNSKSPPLPGKGFETLGYWDVDDSKGNKKFKVSLGGNVRTGTLPYSSRGTYGNSGKNRGVYMASIAIDRSVLHKITDLNAVASNKSVDAVLSEYSKLSLNKKGTYVLYSDNSRGGYLVGVWDVDGGGGYGNNGSSGTYAMQLVAKLRKNKSERKLVDLKLFASNKKGPKILKGYEMVGYWDVDKGGSRGTDGSTGSYMMTLLAKWSK